MARLDAFLQLGAAQGCSDIHLAVGVPPMLRMYGDLMPVKYRDLDAGELTGLLREIVTAEQWAAFLAGQDLDFSYAPPGVGRFRVNLFRKAQGPGATFRVIPAHIPSLDTLGLPPIVQQLTQVQQGLVLVTGATGTGKSTTLAAMLEHLNTTRPFKIITLEDPIEHIFTSKMSLIVQREVGTHVGSFAEGLRAALRQDPDVIMVGELRDADTIAMALTAAETGHLVLGTLHTTNATKTLERIIDATPAEQKRQVTHVLAHVLHGIISQTLVKTADGRGRKAIVEILVMTPAIANLLTSDKIFQIPMVLETGRAQGMQLRDQALMDALQRKHIDPDDAYIHAQDKKLFQRFVTDPRLLPKISLVGA